MQSTHIFSLSLVSMVEFIHVNKLVMDGEYTSVYQWHFEKLGCKMTSKLTFCVGFL